MRIFLGGFLLLLALFGVLVCINGFISLDHTVFHEVVGMLGLVVTTVALGAFYVGAKKT